MSLALPSDDAAPPADQRVWWARALRDADWLTGKRARDYARLWLGVSLVIAVVWVALSHGGVDRAGHALGTDFTSFWTASQMALHGQAQAVYDPALNGPHHLAEIRLFGRDVGYFAFYYPPVFLLLCLPLALLPYMASLALWLGVTGLAYARVVRSFLGDAARQGRIGWVAILAFPAVLANAGHGQNAFLSAALFGGGVLLLDRRPVLAGVLLGSLVFKPHLGLVIPIALLAGGRWRSILGAAAAVIGLCLASFAVFGAGVWRAFLAASPAARAALEQNLVGYEKMASVFAAVRLLHGGVGLAYAIQALAALAVCAALVLAQRKVFRAPAEGPAMICAALLASPFLLDYDLVLLAIPLAWLAAEGLKTGFRPWEKLILAAGFLLPALSRTLAAGVGLPLSPLVIAAVLWLIVRRWTSTPLLR
ncbi:glycosyltransferase family 87 protein [Phenylobacterium montanum]|uniref:DUF2029 domain-containing protein n=1 Tax=Phenylobacterium montanum TaxID=2823693 RepID=A0A975FXP8_9CAUL|nr:glycosyltransferase family 87 protein [Caulobacter sp. S6]QUD86753.1 DUF2029 domain-containing protein [Caulobacter sp. S6]